MKFIDNLVHSLRINRSNNQSFVIMMLAEDISGNQTTNQYALENLTHLFEELNSQLDSIENYNCIETALIVTSSIFVLLIVVMLVCILKCVLKY